MRSFAFFLAAILILSGSLPTAACTNPAGVPGDVVYNGTSNVFQGCTTQGWVAFHASSSSVTPPPQNCPAIGDTCTNGMIYAGDFNGSALYVAANDAPTTMAAGPYQDAATESGMGLCTSPYTGGSCDNGRENTQVLVNLALSYPAAEYCAGLNAHGQSTGWYLPSMNELNMIYLNLKDGEPAGTFNFQNAYYWSSSENSRIWMIRQNFQYGWQDAPNNNQLERVRCVWR